MPQPKDVSILIVEDTVGGRNLAMRMLTSLAYKATPTKSADEALDLIKQGKRFDLMFTDILMPGEMNGIELARVARTYDSKMKILFTSGFSCITSEEMVELDAAYLAKPYRRAEIAAILSSMISG